MTQDSSLKNSNSFDIQRAREHTPACEALMHFNNAGSSLMPKVVSEAMHSYLELEESMGGYEAKDSFNQQLNNFYHSSAKLINCDSGEIAFIENATRA